MPKKVKKSPQKKIHSPSTHTGFFQALVYVSLSFIISILLFQLGIFHQLLHSLHEFGYIGVFISGMLFVSVFTAAPAAVLLFTFAETLPVWSVAVVGGIGSVMGDLIVLHIMEHGFHSSSQFLPKDKGIKRIISLLRHTKYRFVLTILGAIVVASPLPDELGLALMGMGKVKRSTMLLMTLCLNILGILILLYTLR